MTSREKSDRQSIGDRSSNQFSSSTNSSPKLPTLPPGWKFCRAERGTKKPIDSEWQRNPVTSEEIRSWVEQERGNYGVIWGGSAIGLDVDGATAHKKLLEIAAGHKIPSTVSWTSGTPDRYHLAFQLTSEQVALLSEAARSTRAKSSKGRWLIKCGGDGKTEQLEFRWQNHQSILPPSLHPSGSYYRWLSGQSPAEQDVAVMPDWLFTCLLELATPNQVAVPVLEPSIAVVNRSVQIPLVQVLRREERAWIESGVPEGMRNDTAAALARNLIGSASYLMKEQILFEGTPRTLFDSFCDRCQPPIEPSERESIWRSAERSNPKPTLTPDAIANCVAAWENRSRTNHSTEEKTERIMAGSDKAAKVIDLLLMVAEEIEFFHTPDQIAFADVDHNGIRQTLAVRSREFKRYLLYQLYTQFERVASKDAINTALDSLEARALFEGEERQVFIRLAEANGKIYLDLGTDKWNVVEIDQNGWRVRSNYPVRFRRNKNLYALPVPIQNELLDDLWQLINVVPEDRVLVACWLLFCLYPKYAHPLLFFVGEQGSGKTVAAGILACLIDPNKASLLPSVSDLRNLSISANNRWILPYDNISGLSAEQSDALCRISTGVGFTVRTLFENDEETTFEFVRPQIITGIDCPASRGDLLSRSIQVRLRTIPDESRKTEAEIKTMLEQVRPKILGALLTALSKTLNVLPTIKYSPTRLADFARFAIAAEEALGFPKGSFLAAYMSNQQEAHQIAIEASPVAMAIKNFMAFRQTWQGTASELLEELEKLVDEKILKHKGWAGDVRQLGKALVRLAPDLRKGEGIEIEQKHNSRKTQRIIYLSKTQNSSSATSVTSVTEQNPSSETVTKTSISARADNADVTDVNFPGSSPQFKAGDRVIYVGSEFACYQNQMFTIHAIENGYATLRRVDGSFSTWIILSDLRLAGES